MLTLVTGATGLVGNNVVRLLLERGERVRVLQRTTSDPRPLAGLDVEHAQGDVRDADAVRAACAGVQRVIHTAAYVHIGWSNLTTHRAVNVEGTRSVAAAAREVGARLVHVSSVDALRPGVKRQPSDESCLPNVATNGKAVIPYVRTKREAEAAVMAAVGAGLDAVIVNPVYMLGPWDWKPSSGRMLLVLKRNGAFAAPRGGNDFCDVRDVAAGILAAMERGARGERYILGGEPLDYRTAWTQFAGVVGVRPPRMRIGPLVNLVAGVAGDAWGRATGREPDINSAAIRMASEPHHFSYARAARELGYQPRPAREAAQAAWEWFVEHGYVR